MWCASMESIRTGMSWCRSGSPDRGVAVCRSAATMPHRHGSLGWAHYWAREFTKLGHTVKLMSPQFVKPYVQSQKNDPNDAAGICEAVERPRMRGVPVKSVAQQDIQALHRIRERQIKARTALINQIRGLLTEYGIVIPQRASQVRHKLPVRPRRCRKRFDGHSTRMALRPRRGTPGVGSADRDHGHPDRGGVQGRRRLSTTGAAGGDWSSTATALVAAVGDATTFKNGRQFAAWLGPCLASIPRAARRRSSG